MKTKIISIVLVTTMLMQTTVALADTNSVHNNTQRNEQVLTVGGNNYTLIENETSVIVQNANGDNSVLDRATGKITNELNGVVTESNVNDYIVEPATAFSDDVLENQLLNYNEPKSMVMAANDNYQYGNEFTDSYLYQDWFHDGYKYLEGHHSREFNKNGFLFMQDGGKTIINTKKFSFSAGTVITAVIAAVATVATGGTATAVLTGLGFTAGSALIDYLILTVSVEDDTFRYKVRDDNGNVLLETYQVKRYSLGYDHTAGVTTKQFNRMYGGFAGTTSDMIEAGLSL